MRGGKEGKGKGERQANRAYSSVVGGWLVFICLHDCRGWLHFLCRLGLGFVLCFYVCFSWGRRQPGGLMGGRAEESMLGVLTFKGS